MKVRLDFITNSSSASFIIKKKDISEKQLLMIKGHDEFAVLLHYKGYIDRWQITETETTIEGDTSMDNFDMFWFLKEIGIKKDQVAIWHSNGSDYFDPWEEGDDE